MKKSKVAEDSQPNKKNLKIMSLPVDELAKLLPVSNCHGRFYSIKSQVMAEISESLNGHGNYIPLPKEIRHNKKEREAMKNSIVSIFRKTKTDWIIRYSPTSNGFVLMRESDFKKIKNMEEN